jgi:4-hydroxy-tetrahydrodipicolinate synthase
MKKPISAADLRGIFPALLTPTTSEDVIDERAVGIHVDYLLKGGVNGIVPLGGTGEYGSLSHEQRVRMVAACCAAVDGAVPVLPGILAPGFHDAFDTAKAFAQAGADALMVLTPYYTTPTQKGIRDYFLRFADASPLPIVIYEIPYRTRIAVDPEVLHELSRHENIIGMKACNTDMYHFLRVVAGVSADFSVMSGEDTLFPLHMAAGASGGIVVTANLLPRTWGAIYAAGKNRQLQESIELHRKLIPLMDMSFAETNPGPLKSVWELIGVGAPHLLAPLLPAAEELRQRLHAEVRARLEDEAAFAAEGGNGTGNGLGNDIRNGNGAVVDPPARSIANPSFTRTRTPEAKKNRLQLQPVFIGAPHQKA